MFEKGVKTNQERYYCFENMQLNVAWAIGLLDKEINPSKAFLSLISKYEAGAVWDELKLNAKTFEIFHCLMISDKILLCSSVTCSSFESGEFCIAHIFGE